jgi:hypothetical protein
MKIVLLYDFQSWTHPIEAYLCHQSPVDIWIIEFSFWLSFLAPTFLISHIYCLLYPDPDTSITDSKN